ncbi:hypothetical protein C8035_v012021 [Colletotrichum spinosum]|uniref:Fibroin-3 n=1 Tax=Colletotrichum spinosum TaxID=1347390 RepID=A0A4R8PWX8_9PEZI|nr:hypothetical protein C8035_v012021 [Colletotrichum spinosum]
MPTIDVAMARSLRGGVWGSVVSSLAATVEKRQIMSTIQNAGNSVNDVKTAFSSWDNCMKADYCKWPVIGIMVVGGLIIFSIMWCIIRCACCGLSCCCQCCYCLKCCGNCCGCCDPPKGTPHKHLDEPYAPTNQGYKSQAPMGAPVAPFLQQPAHSAYSTAPSAAATPAPPQYAEFEVNKSRSNPADADALPAMPSWEGAGSKKVAIEEEVELEQMKKPAASPNAPNAPLMAPNAMSHPNSPMPGDRSVFGQQSQAGSSGYFANGNVATDPYAVNGQGYNNYDNGYGQSSSSLGVDQYGAAAVAGAAGGMAMGQGRRTPHQGYNNGYGPQRGQTHPAPRQELDAGFNGYEQSGYGIGQPPRNGPSPAARSFTAPPPRNGPSPAPAGYRRSPGPPNDYRGSPAPPNDYRRSPAPPNDYGYDQQDQYANDNYSRQQYGGASRQYSSESTRPLAQPQRSFTVDNPPLSPDLQNSGGFDFQSGFSRPQQYNYNRGPSGGASQHAEPEEQRPPQSSGGTYPGYKAYQPTKDGWSGV